MELLDRVAGTIDRHHLVESGESVLVAVSGGPDSLALLDLMQRLGREHRWQLTVASFDHLWRPEAKEEQAAVAQFARARSLPVVLGTARRQLSDEAGARRQRWAFLDRVAHQVGASRIAVGHTADDRVETMLLNLFRGAGTAGLGAMPARDGVRIRPLLDCRRDEVRSYCQLFRLPFTEDPSNVDPRYARARVRQDLLPLLEQYQPGVFDGLLRVARVCGNERQVLAELAAERLTTMGVTPEPHHYLDGLGQLVWIDLDGWDRRLEGERWLVLRAALQQLAGSLQDVPLTQVEALDALCCGRADVDPMMVVAGRVPLQASRAGDRLLILPVTVDLPEWGPLQLTPGGRVAVAEAAVTIGVSRAGAVVNRLAARLPKPAAGYWTVRSRRPGDRYHPRGRSGTRKVSDLLSEAGVPRLVRNRAPVFLDGDKLVWVAGLPVAEGLRGAALDRWTVAVELVTSR